MTMIHQVKRIIITSKFWWCQKDRTQNVYIQTLFQININHRVWHQDAMMLFVHKIKKRLLLLSKLFPKSAQLMIKCWLFQLLNSVDKLNAQKFLIFVKKLLPNVKTTVMEEDIVKMESVNVLKDFQAIVANKKLFDKLYP